VDFFHVLESKGSITRYWNRCDPYGRTTKLSGDKDATFSFTGHYPHAASGLLLTHYRAYDPNLGRWLSEDPLGHESGELNFYSYVKNGPLTATDPLGLIDSREALRHYIEGSGTPLRMSFADIDTSSVKLWQFPSLRQLR